MRTPLLVACLAVLLTAQSPVADRVERGLRGPVVLKGQAPQRHAIADRMAALKVPGVSIAVVDAGQVAWARGYGQGGDGRAVTPDTLFQAASLSKPVAAMVALRLVELGTLSLDEDVNVKLTSWKVPTTDAAAGESVTLRRLLSHTAGLTVSGFPGYAVGVPVPTLVQLLDGVAPTNTAAVRVDTKPGTLWRYSGGGYQVMQQLVQDVTGKPFARVASELVLQPLGMTSSTFEQPLPQETLARAAAGHDGGGNVIAGKRHTYPEQTAAGLWTTPSDFAQVILEMHGPGRVLKRETVEAMLTPIMNEYGLGFGVQATDGHASFSHGGSNEGFRCVFRGYRDVPRGAVVMTNGANGGRLASEVMRAIAAEYGWPDFKPVERSIVAVPLETLQSYAGSYRMGTRDVIVAVTAGKLTVQGPGQDPVAVESAGDGVFFDVTGAVPEVTFSRNASGQMQLSAGGAIATRQ
jgi:CubicO group peptidase (beta-lactamase class C family)